MKNYMEIPYLFYANPTTFPNWKHSERYGIGLDIDKAWYREKLVWRYRIIKGAYQDCVFEISREKAQEVVIRNAIPSGKCHDLLPISEMKEVKMDEDVKIKEMAEGGTFG